AGTEPDDPPQEAAFSGSWDGLDRRYRYARAGRDESGRLTSVIVAERSSREAAVRLALNTAFLVAAGLVVLGIGLLAIWFVAGRSVLRPVRELREWADAVRAGDAGARVELRTGDELEKLADTLNLLLDELRERQRQLRAVNAAMDIKLNELAEANEVLDEAAELKGQFVASVSHELRTPLNAILGFAGLLQETASKELRENEARQQEPPTSLQRRLRHIGHIETAARNLLHMIEGLLEMARVEAGRVDVRAEPLDAEEFCRGLVGMIEPDAARRGVSVTLEVPRALPPIVTDRRMLQHIVLNLLSNAVKFSDPHTNNGRPGRVVVRAETIAGTDAEGAEVRRFRVSVIDNGPGVPAEEQQRIFERFKQLDGSTTREHGGVGLGLAICRELATVLQGELTLDSSVGQGSMFGLILPLEIDVPGDRESEREPRIALSARSPFDRRPAAEPEPSSPPEPQPEQTLEPSD
ncbi:MAG: HAMP domain-containing sensor histidine kinase, partial [Planctomycetota bacterium]